MCRYEIWANRSGFFFKLAYRGYHHVFFFSDIARRSDFLLYIRWPQATMIP